jgi:dephospho-CoA kinase
MKRLPCTVGLTGGLASGKSTVARLLAELGAEIFDCDTYVHELYSPDGAGTAAVRALFGDAVLGTDRGVDRDLLAAVVLGDDGNRERLERAIHPLVREGADRWLADPARRPVALIEAALLVETGAWRLYDLLLLVWCEPEQQLERAISRGMPAARAQVLLAAQLPLREKRGLADVIVDNSGSRANLEAEIRRAWSTILDLCRVR